MFRSLAIAASAACAVACGAETDEPRGDAELSLRVTADDAYEAASAPVELRAQLVVAGAPVLGADVVFKDEAGQPAWSVRPVSRPESPGDSYKLSSGGWSSAYTVEATSDGVTYTGTAPCPSFFDVTTTPAVPIAGQPATVAWSPSAEDAAVHVQVYGYNTGDLWTTETDDSGQVVAPAEAFPENLAYAIQVWRRRDAQTDGFAGRCTLARELVIEVP